jgi:uncharacterized alkaline shock family protein YloU
MQGNGSVATDVIASYAADAALEVEGVAGLVDGRLPRQGAVRVSQDDGRVSLELHLQLAWDAPAHQVCAEVQRRVADYLGRMAGARPRAVDVVVDDIETAPL